MSSDPGGIEAAPLDEGSLSPFVDVDDVDPEVNLYLDNLFEEEKRSGIFTIHGEEKRVRLNESIKQCVWDDMSVTYCNIGASDGTMGRGVLFKRTSMSHDTETKFLKLLRFEDIALYTILKYRVNTFDITIDEWQRYRKDIRPRVGETDTGDDRKTYRFGRMDGVRISLVGTSKLVADRYHDSMVEYNIVSSPLRGYGGLHMFDFPGVEIVCTARKKLFFQLAEEDRVPFCAQQMFDTANLMEEDQTTLEAHAQIDTEPPLKKHRTEASYSREGPKTEEYLKERVEKAEQEAQMLRTQLAEHATQHKQAQHTQHSSPSSDTVESIDSEEQEKILDKIIIDEYSSHENYEHAYRRFIQCMEHVHIGCSDTSVDADKLNDAFVAAQMKMVPSLFVCAAFASVVFFAVAVYTKYSLSSSSVCRLLTVVTLLLLLIGASCSTDCLHLLTVRLGPFVCALQCFGAAITLVTNAQVTCDAEEFVLYGVAAFILKVGLASLAHRILNGIFNTFLDLYFLWKSDQPLIATSVAVFLILKASVVLFAEFLGDVVINIRRRMFYSRVSSCALRKKNRYTIT